MRASTVATALKKVTIIYPRFAIILIKRIIIIIIIYYYYYYYYYYYTTKNSSAMAQTTPKIRSFSLANVSAELSLKN